MRAIFCAAIMVPLVYYAPLAAAQSSEAPRFSINGFGTVGVVRSNMDRADMISDFFDPEGAGHSGTLSPEVDSRLGLQLTTDLSSKISNVVQVVMEQQHDDTWKPHVEWANLKYQVNPNLYVRVGRIVLPGVMASEYRKVGYALPWVRPPLEVYGIEPVSNNDGIDIGYDFRWRDFNNTVRFIAGRKDIDLPRPRTGEIRVRDLWGITGTVKRDFLTLHASYEHGRITVDSLEFNELFSAFRQLGPEGVAVANRYEARAKSIDFIGLGANYDQGDWFLGGEWGRLDSRSFIGKRQGWYLSGGYRFGPFMPYATFARVDAGSTTSPGLSTASLPSSLAATAQGLNAGLNSLLNLAPRQKTLSFGVRWDSFQAIAFKFQYDHIDLSQDSKGFLTNIQPDFKPGGSVSLFSATLDFVF